MWVAEIYELTLESELGVGVLSHRFSPVFCVLQTAQTVLLLVAAFALCWLPHHVIAMWVEFGAFPLDDASFAFRIIAHCLSYGNSCINPVLYAFLSQNFRQACRQVFTRRIPPDKKVVRFRNENFSSTHSLTNL